MERIPVGRFLKQKETTKQQQKSVHHNRRKNFSNELSPLFLKAAKHHLLTFACLNTHTNINFRVKTHMPKLIPLPPWGDETIINIDWL